MSAAFCHSFPAYDVRPDFSSLFYLGRKVEGSSLSATGAFAARSLEVRKRRRSGRDSSACFPFSVCFSLLASPLLPYRYFTSSARLASGLSNGEGADATHSWRQRLLRVFRHSEGHRLPLLFTYFLFLPATFERGTWRRGGGVDGAEQCEIEFLLPERPRWLGRCSIIGVSRLYFAEGSRDHYGAV